MLGAIATYSPATQAICYLRISPEGDTYDRPSLRRVVVLMRLGAASDCGASTEDFGGSDP